MTTLQELKSLLENMRILYRDRADHTNQSLQQSLLLDKIKSVEHTIAILESQEFSEPTPQETPKPVVYNEDYLSTYQGSIIDRLIQKG